MTMQIKCIGIVYYIYVKNAAGERTIYQRILILEALVQMRYYV